MPAESMPDFQHAVLISRGALDAAELAECHGVLCGLVCRNADVTPEQFLSQLKALQILEAPDSRLLELLAEAHQATLEQLADMDMGFQLWLPDDDQPLPERTDSLAQWCNGLLAGLGLEGPLPDLSQDAMEALEDLRQIAQAAYSNAGDDGAAGLDESEEESETAFTEIVEYVRVVTLMLREEMRGPGVDDRIH